MDLNDVDTMAANNMEDKREKIRLNYETIKVLKDKLGENNKTHQSRGMTRAAYVKMILDATKKVNNQNEELGKVIIETRKLQKDIGSLSGRLERSFSLVESIILRGAKNDKWCGECHQLLRTMHENCDQLIRAVEDTGEITREIRQLEEQIGRIKAMATLRVTAAIIPMAHPVVVTASQLSKP